MSLTRMLTMWLAVAGLMSMLLACDSSVTGTQNPGGPAPSVASVAITPGSASVGVGGSTTLTAVPKDASGNTLTGKAVDWKSSNEKVATVSASGLVRGVAAGTATITATAEGKSGTAQMTVAASPPPAPPASGSNEPAGLTPIYRADGTQKSGWHKDFVYSNRWLDDKYVQVVDDPAAKHGKAIEKRFFIGDTDGFNGFANAHGMSASPSGYSELYFRLTFRFSPNWDFHKSGTHKLIYFGGKWEGTANDFYLSAHGTSDPLQFRFNPQGGDGEDGQQADRLFPTQSGVELWLDRYHTVEVWVKAQSAPGASDGQVRTWINGTEVTSWNRPNTGLQFYSASKSTAKLDGISSFLYWGGGPDTKTANDWIRISELYVSGKP